MPGIAHEAPVELLRRNPLLAAALLRGIGMTTLPDEPAVMVNSDVSSALPAELRADAVVVLGGAGAVPKEVQQAKIAVVIEVQTSHDGSKRLVWPAYLTLARAQHKCPAVLLVICPRPDVGLWARQAIATGHPGFNLRPLVIDADSTPLPDTPGLDRAAPELAVLAAFTRAIDLDRDKARRQVLDILATSRLDADRLKTYTRLVRAAASPAARIALEALMTTTYKDDFVDRLMAEGWAQGEAAGRAAGEAAGRAKGKAEGKAEGEAGMLLMILAARGIEVPDGIREQVRACSDPSELGTWAERAATATSIEDVFPG